MNLKNFDYKQFLIDHGERIGLGAAAVITLFMVASLFFPGMGFMSGSASSNAEALAASTKTVENGLASDKPTETDNPGDPTPKLTAFNFGIIDADKAKDYAINEIFTPPNEAGLSRRMPELLLPQESRAEVVRLQLPSLVFDSDTDPKQLLVLDDAPTATGPGGKATASMPNTAQISQLLNRSNGEAGSFDARAAMIVPGKRRRAKFHPGDGSDQEDLKSHFEDIAKIGSLTDKKLAEEAYPVRAAEITASFPYKAQVEEFRNKLALAADEQVLAEPSQEVGKNGEPLPAFRFIGVRLERRQVDAQGKPINASGQGGGWTEVNLEDSYKNLVIRVGKRFEEDDPKLAPVSFANRLVMRKLLTFGDRRVPPVDEYPKLEEQMPNLKATIDALNKDPSAVVAAPSIINKDFSVFDLSEDSGQPTQPGGKPPMGMAPGGRFPSGGSSSRVFVPQPFGGKDKESSTKTPNAYGAGFLQTGQAFTIPDYILIRLFDVTVEPGKTYEYRMQVRMGNPNKDRTDTASQAFAHQPELPAKDWYVLPEKVKVPLDVNYYAVDQARLDAAGPKEPKDPSQPKEVRTPIHPLKDNQTALQIQKWVETLKTKREEEPIGDWVIAERVIALRGEPISPQKVEVPYWRKTQDRFTLATDGPSKSGRKGPPKVELSFSDGDEPIVVDFTGGDVTYKRPGQTQPITDKGTAVDVLLLMPDGTLMARDSAKDAVDPQRVARLNKERDWIEEVKNTKGGKDANAPFGPGGSSSNLNK